MTEVEFAWDEQKSRSNVGKHGVNFDEAATAFFDEQAIVFHDPDHDREDRFLLLGMSERLRLLVVCHCYKEKHNVIRIILARKASKSESGAYPEG